MIAMPARCLASALLALVPLLAFADATPVGTWTTMDDDGGEPRSVVAIRIEDGELRGRIVELIDPPEPSPVCEACEGERKGQPVEGMEILWGLTRDDDRWSGGHILDPENGKVYDARVSLQDGGQTLKVRGFLGVSLLGRTQLWERRSAESP